MIKKQKKTTAARALPIPEGSRGRFHDLREIFDYLNAEYFRRVADAKIVWGWPYGRPRHGDETLGTYTYEERRIIVHPILDQAGVPRYVVEATVFHEMLHQFIPYRTVRGRHIFHTPFFLEAERQFRHYDLVRQWEKRNLKRFFLAI